MFDNPMSTPAKREIIEVYKIVRHARGYGTMVQRVAKFMGKKLDAHGGHSQIRRTILEYHQIMRETSKADE